MRFYSVHLRRHGLDPDRDVVVVKEGFAWPAFLFTTLWALWHRLWLAAAAIVLAQALAAAVVHAVGADAVSGFVISLALAAVVGVVANDARRRKLDAQGYELAGVVSGDNGDMALRRFLDGQPALARDLNPPGLTP